MFTLGTAAWNKNSVMLDNVLFVAVKFMDIMFDSDIFSKAKTILSPLFS